MQNRDDTLRDPSRTAAHYHALARDEERDVEREADLGIPSLTAALRLLRAANARYSAGAAPADVLRTLDHAAACRINYFAQNDYRLLGYGHLTMDLEVFSGAALIGCVDELVSAFSRCTIQKPPVVGILAMMEQFCAMWRGEHRPLTAAEAAGLKKLSPDWLLMPPLLGAVVDGNRRAFAAHLEAYLDRWWAKNVRSMLRDEAYAGRWCVLAAGLCQQMAFVPDLPPKTAQYIPVALVGSPAST